MGPAADHRSPGDDGGAPRSSPQRLSPPPRIRGAEPAPLASRQAPPKRRGAIVTVTALIAAAAALALVFIVLPRWIEQRPAPESPVIVASSSEIVEAPIALDAPLSLDAVAAAAKLLHTRVEEMTGRGAHDWGGATWVEIQRLATSGDTHLSAGRQAQANDAYHRATEQLDALDMESVETAQRQLEAGRRALAAGDSDAARRAFAIVDRIQPGNEEAAAGIKRADIYDQVFDLIEGAAASQRSGDLERAAEAARQALHLDPSSERAGDILARSRAQIGERSFSAAMTEGLSALEAGDFEAAREAFTRARSINPEAPGPAAGLERAQIGLRHQAIDGHRRRAEELEQAESWREAAARYISVLAVDPGLAFAREGVDRCEQRARLAGRLERTISSPRRLVSNAVLAEAEGLLAEARGIRPQGPIHLRQVDELARILAVAATPVDVIFHSDGLTSVVIHQVERLGTFERRSLRLRPGTYVVVGSRPGFRDVRMEIDVTPGSAHAPVIVRCTEGI